ncbi:MAG: group II intron reverse transcriptase domain-containing protein [Bacteroidales bacterium]|nr:group II intron reverse transcriptase domain-containing protein [Bacteroidales bacterium]
MDKYVYATVGGVPFHVYLLAHQLEHHIHRILEVHLRLTLDIDDYFSHIDHDRLERRVRGISQDSELVRLIMLCVKMGAVTRKLSWRESEEGVHQGAVLSPCLANLYLHGFDVFVTARTRNYVRYADDFVILCHSKEETESLLAELQPFLRDKLCLELNPPVISAVKDGFEFLGIRLDNQDVSLARGKKETILEHIESFYLTQKGLTRQAARRQVRDIADFLLDGKRYLPYKAKW